METPVFHPDPIAVYLAAALLGIAFAAVVYVWRHVDPDHGVTPFWVVIGDALAVGFLALLEGIGPAVTLVAILTVLGLPQIVGYYIARIRTKQTRRLSL